MFNNIKRVAAVIALTGWMGVANASLIFDFSYGTTGNELVGEITGLVDGIDGQVQSAVSIRFTTATGAYAAFNEFSVDITDSQVYDTFYNQFVVVDKMIISYDFRIEYDGYDSIEGVYKYFILSFRPLRLAVNDFENSGDYFAEPSDFNGFVNRVAPTPAPEPSAVFLLALGLAGVSFSRYKKKS
jgi:hypothetical protein